MISDADLIAHTKAEDAEISTLRRLEKAAIAMIQKRTGRYFGEVAEIVEYLQWRGWPMLLANEPIDGAVELESWSSGAWNAVEASAFAIHGSYIFWETTYSALTMPTRYRATYEAGYESDDDAPEDIKQAVLLLVGHWNENREAVVVGDTATDELPLAVSALLDPHTRVSV
jgi:uncharacterized phiE125 gp8 family phage protein